MLCICACMQALGVGLSIQAFQGTCLSKSRSRLGTRCRLRQLAKLHEQLGATPVLRSAQTLPAMYLTSTNQLPSTNL